MTKRVTLTVPDELAEKIEKWKDHFNLSGVFQEAIRKAIQSKEDFKKRLKEGGDMDQIVERLKREWAELAIDWFEQGKTEGLGWAKAASYGDLVLVATSFVPLDDAKERIYSYDPARHELLGDYFRDVMDNHQEFLFDQTQPGNCVPNWFFRRWEKGWAEGVREFWNEVKDKL